MPLPISVTMDLQRDTGPSSFAEAVLASDPAEARRFQDQIEQYLLQSSHASTHEIFSIKLALEEALINAIKHGNQLDRSNVAGQFAPHIHPKRRAENTGAALQQRAREQFMATRANRCLQLIDLNLQHTGPPNDFVYILKKPFLIASFSGDAGIFRRSFGLGFRP